MGCSFHLIQCQNSVTNITFYTNELAVQGTFKYKAIIYEKKHIPCDFEDEGRAFLNLASAEESEVVQ